MLCQLVWLIIINVRCNKIVNTLYYLKKLMLTLENLLSQSHAATSFGAGLQHLTRCSLFATRLMIKNAHLLQDLLQNHQQIYEIAEMQQFLAAAKIDDEASLKKVLRQLRQRVILRTMYRDLNGLADLNEVLKTTSELAEVCIQTAVHINMAWLQASIHKASGASNFSRDNNADKTSGFIVVGMGKLGGSELNVSSDIDLIFAYQENANWQSALSQHDFYNQLGKKVIAALDEVTEDGFVFRVDMRLRPFGSEGVLVPSLDALEDYYQNYGREWERYAWIKGRVVYPNNNALQTNIHGLLRPFIFRKYLDYSALASMRELKLQIHRDVLQKGQSDNIKLGRGGIREIEFIAQVFQLMRGGRDAGLQIKPTILVLSLLKNKGLLKKNVIDELLAAYVFLRNLEHRLMYVDDAQTQALPTNDESKARIALAMGFDQVENKGWDTLLIQLNLHRAQVAAHFDSTFNDAAGNTNNQEKNHEKYHETAIWQNTLEKTAALKGMLDAGYSDTEQSYSRLNMLRQSARYQNLPELSRQRFDALMPLVISQAALEKNADDALLRSIVLLEAICRRASYLALFAEYPQTLHTVIKLCAASPWLAQYLTAHPILLDELLDTRTLYAAPDFVKMRADLSKKMTELFGDTEAQMDAMRHFKHGAILRFAAQDVAGNLQLEKLSDYLSALADMILAVSLQAIWQSLNFKHIDIPKFSVIGYGKLGGKELGYVSDLDIIFLYDDNAPQAAENYARFAQRINNWFNSLTNAGLLYETDLQLRPDGNSGLLVSSVAAFREYQLHKAWVWEHQAITRARFVAGDANIGEAFEVIRIEVMTQARDTEKLKSEVINMREKMYLSQKTGSQKYAPGFFDIKHSAGGIIDVEFMVQYLVLAHAKQHPQLTGNIGNIALLKQLATLNIIEVDTAEKVATAYREYRKMQHALKLQGSPNMLMEATSVSAHMAEVKALWNQVFAD
jgi:[glutamine synthetase] adenylyltransferase / [glutamine synthetase]-adenylyl-L-tyrosine phosphorylase